MNHSFHFGVLKFDISLFKPGFVTVCLRNEADNENLWKMHLPIEEFNEAIVNLLVFVKIEGEKLK